MQRLINSARLFLVLRGIVPKPRPHIKPAPSPAGARAWLASRGIYEPKALYGSPEGIK
jgi:hypothetical protein